MLKRFIENFKNNNLKQKKYYTSMPDINDNNFIKGLSKKALDLYERQKDIEKFTQIALSKNNTPFENSLITDLLDKGIINDSLIKDDIKALSENKDFLRDLGL